VVLGILRDISKGSQLNCNTALESPIGTSAATKTNIGACEIDPGKLGFDIEIRRAVKTRIGKIGITIESAAGEIGFVIEARALEGNGYETIRPGAEAAP